MLSRILSVVSDLVMRIMSAVRACASLFPWQENPERSHLAEEARVFSRAALCCLCLAMSCWNSDRLNKIFAINCRSMLQHVAAIQRRVLDHLLNGYHWQARLPKSGS